MILYRVNEDYYFLAPVNLLSRYTEIGGETQFIEYKVEKETDKRYYFYEHGKVMANMFRSNMRWTPKEGKNLFAFKTKEDAVNNFLIRKKKQLGYLEVKIKNIRSLIKLVEKWK